MNRDEFQQWIRELQTSIPRFVKNMEVPEKPGKYRLSWSGDIPPSSAHWGLGQATFAARVLLIFDALTPVTTRDLAAYILSFEHWNGALYDDYVQKVTRRQRWRDGLRQKKP